MRGFERRYEFLWPGDVRPERYSRRYDGVDRVMNRPIHRGMSVAPPGARTVWLCQRCRCAHYLCSRMECLLHRWRLD